MSQADWKVGNQHDFLQLEPWAVPCDNTWMKDNWNRWQGYTFYTQPSAVEKCVTVTFNLGMQPVVAFVGGLQFEILPAASLRAGHDRLLAEPATRRSRLERASLRGEVRGHPALQPHLAPDEALRGRHGLHSLERPWWLLHLAEQCRHR